MSESVGFLEKGKQKKWFNKDNINEVKESWQVKLNWLHEPNMINLAGI